LNFGECGYQKGRMESGFGVQLEMGFWTHGPGERVRARRWAGLYIPIYVLAWRGTHFASLGGNFANVKFKAEFIRRNCPLLVHSIALPNLVSSIPSPGHLQLASHMILIMIYLYFEYFCHIYAVKQSHTFFSKFQEFGCTSARMTCLAAWIGSGRHL
jgi:hypothetical protein